MNSEKVKEIKRALECCINNKGCNLCTRGKLPYDLDECRLVLTNDILTLINEYETVIPEKLKQLAEKLKEKFNRQEERFAADVTRFENDLDKVKESDLPTAKYLIGKATGQATMAEKAQYYIDETLNEFIKR